MNEKKRIIELVDRGIISTDEAIVLLEKSQSSESTNFRKQSEAEFKKSNQQTKGQYTEDPLNNRREFESFAESHLGENKERVTDKLGTFFKDLFASHQEGQADDSDALGIQDEFTHEFYYPNIKATSIDFKVANGHLSFQTWDQPDFKVEAKIKLYGKMIAETAFEAFLERSKLAITDEMILFHIPNKRIKVEFLIYLPAVTYDHISIKLLNGNIKLSDVSANDLFIKSTNGDKLIERTTGKMLELDGVNGNTVLNNVDLVEFMSHSGNGNSDLSGAFKVVTVKKNNGEFNLKNNNPDLEKVDVKIKVGTVKVCLPKALPMEAVVKTNFGTIKTQLEEIETILDRKDRGGHQTQFQRLADNVPLNQQLKVMLDTGNIYINED